MRTTGWKLAETPILASSAISCSHTKPSHSPMLYDIRLCVTNPSLAKPHPCHNILAYDPSAVVSDIAGCGWEGNLSSLSTNQPDMVCANAMLHSPKFAGWYVARLIPMPAPDRALVDRRRLFCCSKRTGIGDNDCPSALDNSEICDTGV